MALLKHFKKNESGRDLIIGDIHGHFSKAYAALLNVGFDPAIDRVFSVGDLVDRGPESINATDWLAKPWFHAVRGNHEQMCIEQIDQYMHMVNGGAWFIALTSEEKREYIEAFFQLPIALTIETVEGRVGVVHADPNADSWTRLEHHLSAEIPDEGFVQGCIWSRERITSEFGGEVDGIRAVVVGHTPVERMTSLGNVIYIDTGAWLPEARFPGKAFTILDAATLSPAYSPVLDFTS